MPLYVPVLCALLGGLLLPLFHFSSRRARSAYVFLVTLAASVCAWVVILSPAQPELTLIHITEDFSLRLRADGMTRVFMGLSSFLWPLATLYAFEYMAHETRENAFFTF